MFLKESLESISCIASDACRCMHTYAMHGIGNAFLLLSPFYCSPRLVDPCGSLLTELYQHVCFQQALFFNRARAARRSAVSRTFWHRRSKTLEHWRQRRLTARLKKEIRHQKAHAFCKVPCTRLSRLNAARPQVLQMRLLVSRPPQYHRNKRRFENECAWQPCTRTPKHQ